MILNPDFIIRFILWGMQKAIFLHSHEQGLVCPFKEMGLTILSWLMAVVETFISTLRTIPQLKKSLFHLTMWVNSKDATLAEVVAPPRKWRSVILIETARWILSSADTTFR